MANILIVDDRPLNREYLKTLLGYAHHHILEAEDGAKALTLAKKEKLDLIITDIIMPSLNGYELAEQLLADPTTKLIPIIFYTATYRAEDARKVAKTCGVNYVLSKPCDPQIMLETINQALGIKESNISHLPANLANSNLMVLDSPKLDQISAQLSSRLNAMEVFEKSMQQFFYEAKAWVKEQQVLAEKLQHFSLNLQQLRKLSSQLTSVAEFNLDLISEREPQKLLTLFSQGINRIMETQYCVLGTLGSDEQTVTEYYKATNKLEPTHQVAQDFPIDEKIVSHILKEKKGFLLNAVNQNDSLHHFLAGPILTSTKIYGFIYLQDRIDNKIFTPEDQQIFNTLVAALAVLYENLDLTRLIQEHATHLQLEINERKEIQSALRKSELLFRQFAENIDAVFWRAEIPTGKIQYVSPSFEKIWGLPAEKIYQYPNLWNESIRPEDRTLVAENLSRLSQGKITKAEMEYTIIRSDGDTRLILDRGFHLKDETENIIGLLGIATDITEYKKNQIFATIQQQISKLFDKDLPIKDIIANIQEILTRFFQWDISALWLLNKEKQNLSCIHIFIEDEKFKPFLKANLTTPLHKKEGLRHKVWHSQTPYWAHHLQSEASFLRLNAAKEVGLQSALFFPVMYKKQSVGVFEFFSSSLKKPDPVFLEQLKLISMQIAEYIEHIYASEQVFKISQEDPVTHFLNRQAFEEKFKERSQQIPGLIPVFIFEIDQTSWVNEAFGHATLASIHKKIAYKMRQSFLQQENIIARFSDKFVISLMKNIHKEDIDWYINTILELFKEPFFIEGQEIFLTCSIGISFYPQDGQEANILIKNAEIALGRAQLQTGSRCQFYTPEGSDSSAKLVLTSALKKALLEKQFCLYYQPKVNLHDGRITGLEALLRWNHPQKGLLLPGDFLQTAEQTDLIVFINDWVLQEALKDIKEHFNRFNIPVAVNLSSYQLDEQHNLLHLVKKYLAELAIPPNLLELEITETALMRNAAYATKLLKKVRDLQVVVSLDDFGTGYCSLNYLQRFSLDKIKIDKSFIDGIPNHERQIAILKALITLAHNLNLKAVAEGVETREQLQLLLAEHCDELQGFLFSRPLPLDEVLLLLNEDRRLNITPI